MLREYILCISFNFFIWLYKVEWNAEKVLYIYIERERAHSEANENKKFGRWIREEKKKRSSFGNIWAVKIKKRGGEKEGKEQKIS